MFPSFGSGLRLTRSNIENNRIWIRPTGKIRILIEQKNPEPCPIFKPGSIFDPVNFLSKFLKLKKFILIHIFYRLGSKSDQTRLSGPDPNSGEISMFICEGCLHFHGRTTHPFFQLSFSFFLCHFSALFDELFISVLYWHCAYCRMFSHTHNNSRDVQMIFKYLI